MPLYIGHIEDKGRLKMYVSNVSCQLTAEDASDLFEAESFFVEFSDNCKRGDPISEGVELTVLRNKLTNGGAQVVIES